MLRRTQRTRPQATHNAILETLKQSCEPGIFTQNLIQNFCTYPETFCMVVPRNALALR